MDSTIANLRLNAQHIQPADFASAHDVVAAMGAMQAQDYAGALWAIGLRTSGLTQTDIEDAIQKGEIIRTWPMRGTLHFVASEDAKWMVDLMGPRAARKAASVRSKLGIGEQDISRAMAVLGNELGGKRYRSRPDVIALLEEKGIATAGQRGLHILGYLAEHGYLCLGPHIGKQPSFVLLDEWAGKSHAPSRDEALQKLTLTYFKSHGPASENDFANWTGLTLTDVRRGIELAGTSLAKITINAIDYWLDPATQPAPPKTMFILPGFDEYMLGYRDRSAALAPEHSNRIVPGGNGMFLSTVVRDGSVVGTWKRTIKKQTVAIEIIPFASFSDTDRQLIQEKANAYGAFVGLAAEVTFS